MPDNLSIHIGADTTKLVADLAKANAEISKFGTALRSAARAGDDAGIQRFAASLEGARKDAYDLNQQLRQLHATAREGIGHFSSLTEQIEDLAKSFASVGTGISAFETGLAGAGIVELAREIAEQFKAVNEAMQQLQNTARATNFDTTTIATFQEALKETGQDAGIAASSLQKLEQQAAKARLEYQQSAYKVQSLDDYFKSLVTPVASAASNIADLSDGFRILNIEASRYAQTAPAQRQLLTDVAQRLVAFRNAGRIDEADVAAVDLFGKKYTELAAALDKLADPKYGQGLLAKGVIPTKEDLARANEFDEGLTDLGQAFRGLRNELLIPIFPFLGGQFRAMSADIQEMVRSFSSVINFFKSNRGIQEAAAEIGKAWSGLADFFSGLSRSIAQAMNAGWQAIVDAATAAYQQVIGIWNSLPSFFSNIASSIGDMLSSLRDSIKNALSDANPVGGSGSGAAPMAAGGTVRGTGTGDSVPAMLTPGEFVNRLASVQYYGVGLFRALNARAIPRGMFNGFAMGGLVDGLHAPARGFADGGLVTSAAGTPVHLHIGGSSFALTGAPSVASALVFEAGKHQMRSTGVKPSWYGGRPGA